MGPTGSSCEAVRFRLTSICSSNRGPFTSPVPNGQSPALASEPGDKWSEVRRERPSRDGAQAKGRTRLPAAIALLGLTSFFTDVGTEMIFPLLPVFLASLGAAPVFLGLVEGAADATSSLLKLAFGYVADRAHRKRPLVFTGSFIATIARPLVALATAPWPVLVVRLTDRIGKGIRSAPRDALIAAAARDQEAGRGAGVHPPVDHAGAAARPVVAPGMPPRG